MPATGRALSGFRVAGMARSYGGQSICYAARLLFSNRNVMIETNPIHARIADLTDRVTSLRGYL